MATNEKGYMGDWRDFAACVGIPTDVFFPAASYRPHLIGGKNLNRETGAVAEAKAICQLCPVRQECLDHAMELGLNDGIFGGLTGTDRAKLRRRLSRSALREARRREATRL